MFRENTLDYCKELRAWAVNMASRTIERQNMQGDANAVADAVLAIASKYHEFVSAYTLQDAMDVQHMRQDYIERLRDKVAVDAALQEEMVNARNALDAAKKAGTQEEAERLLKDAGFSFHQVATVQAETVARTVGAAPEMMGREVEND